MGYAYWRRPEGTRYKGKDHKFAPTALLEELGRYAIVKNGSITWHLDSFDMLQTAVLPSVVVVDAAENELNETDARQLVSRSLSEVVRKSGGGEPIAPNELLEEVNSQAAQLFRTPRVKRLLAASVSIGFLCPHITMDGCLIGPDHSREFPLPPDLLEMPSYVTTHLRASHYSKVLVETSEATVHQAYERATTALNCLRGIWNLVATFLSRVITQSSVPKRKWIGVIHIGPIQTLHFEDGSLVDDELYWYDPDYVEDAKLFRPNDLKSFEHGFSWTSSQLEKLPYQKEMVKILARYAVALDQANLDVAFLMLWSLLEKITDTVGANYDRTIDRATWGCRDRAIARQLLNQMRWRRNQLVHSSTSTHEREQLCYIIKHFVDEHLRSLLANDWQINSLNEYGECLDLPTNIEHLEERQRRNQKALDLSRRRDTDGLSI